MNKTFDRAFFVTTPSAAERSWNPCIRSIPLEFTRWGWSNRSLGRSPLPSISLSVSLIFCKFIIDVFPTNILYVGEEVEDFHTLDKAKLFAVNFSATQEIDRIQQQHRIEIDALKLENDTLKSENDLLKARLLAIEQHLGLN